MEYDKKKNMVILKNLPSNLVEEAIVVLKSSKNAKELEKIDNQSKSERTGGNKKEKDYILKEAEMLISSYISKIEDKDKQKQYKFRENNKRYIRAKKYAYLTSFIVIIQAILLIIK